MSTNLFNKNKYLELLVKKNNDNLSKAEFMDLLSYRIILQAQIIYNNREIYISLFEAHLKFETDLDDYSSMVELSDLYDQNLEDLNILEQKILKEGMKVFDDFLIDSNAMKFSDTICVIVQFSEVDEDINEDDYRSIMETKLLELRNCANLASRSYKDQEVLQSVMIFFSCVSIVAYSVLNYNIFHIICRLSN